MFFEISLPLMLTVIGGMWALISADNRHHDHIVKRLDRIGSRLDSMEARLHDFGRTLTRLEERTSLLRH
jgi:hypothetical protein